MCAFNYHRVNIFLRYLENHYNPGELVEKLDITMEDLLSYLQEYIFDNLDIFEDDLIHTGIIPEGDYDYDYDH